MKKNFRAILILILFIFTSSYVGFSTEACNAATKASANAEKNVFLTFDDGPSFYVTPSILDTLKQHGVKATFFVVGLNVEKHPNIVRRIFDEGHSLGIHCYKHDYSYLYTDVKTFEKDIESSILALKKIIPNYRFSYMRFPGGSFNIDKKFLDAVNKFGLKYIDWNCINGDTQQKNITKNQALANVIQTSFNRKNVVVLMHDNKSISAECLDSVILHFKSNGYNFNKL